jgi:crossover junction endodeoxyribonuclease RuvC
MSLIPIRIIGIDPGLRNLGWGVIESAGSRLSFVACGSIHSDAAQSLAHRLRQLHDGLMAVLRDHAPAEASVEETFVNRDPQSALKLGQARGIALLAPALAGLPVAEYSANLIKKTVVGAGHADKAQVAMMVRILLPRCDAKSADAADALAAAITHAQHRGARELEARVAGLKVSAKR